MFIAKEQEAKELGKGDEEIMEFIEKLKKIKGNRKVMARYYGEDDMDASYDEGKQDGKLEGRQESLEETATKMLKKGLDPKIVQECTNLPLKKIHSIMSLLQ